jgi:hypothetical protein
MKNQHRLCLVHVVRSDISQVFWPADIRRVRRDIWCNQSSAISLPAYEFFRYAPCSMRYASFRASPILFPASPLPRFSDSFNHRFPEIYNLMDVPHFVL